MTTEQAIDIADLERKTKDELLAVAVNIGLENGSALTNLRRDEVLLRIFQNVLGAPRSACQRGA